MDREPLNNMDRFDAKVNILDLRKFDKKETHGFKNFFDSIDEAREIVWSDKVAIVLNAYKEAKDKNIRLVPKVQSAKNIKQRKI